MKYFSMFSGVGGFELGIQNAYRSKNRRSQSYQKGESQTRQGLQPEKSQETDSEDRWVGSGVADSSDKRPLCVGYSEIDKYAIETYKSHFGGHKNYGDATLINERELPDFDLLVGGFPCQAFSVAGKRKGFDDTRGTLFFDIARILKHKRPRHLVLENVKGLLSHDSGKTFQTILGVLTDLGYVVEWQVLNAKDFGVPQNRERVFIVGHLGNECGRKVFPITRANRADTFVRTIRAGGAGSATEKHARDLIQVNQPKHSNDRVYGAGGISPTLNTMQGGRRQPFIEQKPRIRRLTPKECERLMSWPDNWTIGSDTQRYKQCGNGVVSNCVQAIIERIYL